MPPNWYKAVSSNLGRLECHPKLLSLLNQGSGKGAVLGVTFAT